MKGIANNFISYCVLLFISLIFVSCEKDEPSWDDYSQSEEVEEFDIPYNVDSIKDALEILVIGHSFAVDITNKVPEILKLHAIENIHISQLFTGFLSIEQNINGLMDSRNIYDEFFYSYNNEWHYQETKPLSDILRRKKWDIIIITDPGAKYHYPQNQIQNIKAFISLMKTKIDYSPRFVWLEGWAYIDEVRSGNFEVYNWSEEQMFKEIISTTKNVIYPSNYFWKIVPAGMALQNARMTELNNTSMHLTRDGLHADLGFARTLLAYTFFTTVILPYSDIPFSEIKVIDWHEGAIVCNAQTKQILLDCLSHAVRYPYKLLNK